MKNGCKHLRWIGVGVLAMSLAFSASATHELDYTTIRGGSPAPLSVEDMLEKSLLYNVLGFERWMRDATLGTTMVKKDFEPVKSKLLRATFAELEYTYEKDGVLETRVYHSVSGYDFPHYMGAPRSVPSTPTSPFPPTTPTTPTSPASSSGSSSGRLQSSDGLFPQGWSPTEDFDKYFESSSVQKRAKILPTDQSSIVADNSLTSDQYIHDMDAEIKGIRTVERDILAGEVARGGRLHVVVSKPVCGSCDQAMRTFSETYDIDMRITEFAENSSAWKNFNRARTEALDRVWKHTVRRQSSANEELDPPTSLFEDLGEDAMRACGPSGVR